MDYKQFRTQVVSRGCIIRGGEEAMVVFTPKVRLELNLVGEFLGGARYKVYNYNTEETLEGAHRLQDIIETLFSETEIVDLFSWYSSDWKVVQKGRVLTCIIGLIDQRTATLEDVGIALVACDDIKYLILMSEYIPDEVKAALCKGILEIKHEVEKSGRSLRG